MVRWDGPASSPKESGPISLSCVTARPRGRATAPAKGQQGRPRPPRPRRRRLERHALARSRRRTHGHRRPPDRMIRRRPVAAAPMTISRPRHRPRGSAPNRQPKIAPRAGKPAKKRASSPSSTIPRPATHRRADGSSHHSSKGPVQQHFGKDVQPRKNPWSSLFWRTIVGCGGAARFGLAGAPASDAGPVSGGALRPAFERGVAARDRGRSGEPGGAALSRGSTRRVALDPVGRQREAVLRGLRRSVRRDGASGAARAQAQAQAQAQAGPRGAGEQPWSSVQGNTSSTNGGSADGLKVSTGMRMDQLTTHIHPGPRDSLSLIHQHDPRTGQCGFTAKNHVNSKTWNGSDRNLDHVSVSAETGPESSINYVIRIFLCPAS